MWPSSLLLAVALTYFVVDKFWLSKARPHSESPVRAPLRPPSPNKSIAVLPFVDLTEKHDQEYFAGGMAEEVI